MKNNILFLILIAVFLYSCRKEKAESNATFTKTKIDGFSQKGPFVNGSSLTLYELNNSFSQTGKSFNTQMKDNSGLFELNNISLITQYAKLKADGFYFNEVTNSNSSASITLYAISDLTDKSTINVNILSNLEVLRVEYLMKNGSSFIDAKKQAMKEILNIFYIDKNDLFQPETLNISQDGDNNAILLAISLIIQGYTSEADMTQLMGNISTDIQSDGILSNQTFGSALINNAKLLDLTKIRTNIESKYSSLGVSAKIPNFEKYNTQFIDSCKYTFTNYVTFPDNGLYGINILNTNDSIFTLYGHYSFSANLPSGTSMKIICNEDYVSGNSIIGINSVSINGWSISFPGTTKMFNSNKIGTLDMEVQTNSVDVNPGSNTLYFYENNSIAPTRIKKIYVQ